MNKIIVAVDFSDITSILIDKAAEIARCIKARTYIIHIAAPDPDFIGMKAGPDHERISRVNELKKEKKLLEQLANNLREQELEAIPLLIQGSTSELIQKEVKRINASMLIIGTHGDGSTISKILGSTSHNIIRNISCPVLLIPYNKNIQ